MQKQETRFIWVKGQSKYIWEDVKQILRMGLLDYLNWGKNHTPQKLRPIEEFWYDLQQFSEMIVVSFILFQNATLVLL